METVETIQRVIPFLLIGLNGYVCWRKPSLLFNVFLTFLVIGVLAEMGMVFVEHELNRRDWAWEIRNIYGFFDTVILMWIAVRYGNYKNSIRKARLFASVVGGVWIVFLLLHYFNVLAFQIGAMESTANVVLSLAMGFALLTRVEVTDQPLVNPINLLLCSQLVYLFSTVMIFGLGEMPIRNRLYFIHDIAHFLRDLLIVTALLKELKTIKVEASKF